MFTLCGSSSGKVACNVMQNILPLPFCRCHFATATATQNGVGTYLLALPLPQPLPLPYRVNKSICYCGIQLLWQKNVTVAAAAAAPCERIFTGALHFPMANWHLKKSINNRINITQWIITWWLILILRDNFTSRGNYNYTFSPPIEPNIGNFDVTWVKCGLS